jgi:hypothetical protein
MKATIQVHLNNVQLPQGDVKYLGLHLGRRHRESVIMQTNEDI